MHKRLDAINHQREGSSSTEREGIHSFFSTLGYTSLGKHTQVRYGSHPHILEHTVVHTSTSDVATNSLVPIVVSTTFEPSRQPGKN